jgi:hypothetical protein
MKDTSEWLVAITFRPIAWVSESIVIVAQNLDTSAFAGVIGSLQPTH